MIIIYRYEMHCHTSEGSKCGKISGKEQAEIYKKAGYDGIVITDHFFNGNSTAPHHISWEEKLKYLKSGYEAAKKRGDEIGLDVFFAWEVSHHGTDFLTYGLGEEWLLENPYCDQIAMKDYCSLVHNAGGYLVQAHPFREAQYIEMIRLLPRDVDAVETLNAQRTEFENKMADMYADNYSKIKFCGSDNHTGIVKKYAALDLNFRAKSTSEILKAVCNNEHKIGVYDAKIEKDEIILG